MFPSQWSLETDWMLEGGTLHLLLIAIKVEHLLTWFSTNHSLLWKGQSIHSVTDSLTDDLEASVGVESVSEDHHSDNSLWCLQLSELTVMFCCWCVSDDVHSGWVQADCPYESMLCCTVQSVLLTSDLQRHLPSTTIIFTRWYSVCIYSVLYIFRECYYIGILSDGYCIISGLFTFSTFSI